MIQVPDDKFGTTGRWAPEVGAQLILSHAPGRIVTVTAKIEIEDTMGAAESARAANSFNVTLLESSTERLDPGSGVVMCMPVGAHSPPPSPAPSPAYPPGDSPDRAPLPHRLPQRPPYHRPAMQHERAPALLPLPPHTTHTPPLPLPPFPLHRILSRRTRAEHAHPPHSL